MSKPFECLQQARGSRCDSWKKGRDPCTPPTISLSIAVHKTQGVLMQQLCGELEVKDLCWHALRDQQAPSQAKNSHSEYISGCLRLDMLTCILSGLQDSATGIDPAVTDMS